jgi:hypothetical protein
MRPGSLPRSTSTTVSPPGASSESPSRRIPAAARGGQGRGGVAPERGVRREFVAEQGRQRLPVEQSGLAAAAGELSRARAAAEGGPCLHPRCRFSLLQLKVAGAHFPFTPVWPAATTSYSRFPKTPAHCAAVVNCAPPNHLWPFYHPHPARGGTRKPMAGNRELIRWESGILAGGRRAC